MTELLCPIEMADPRRACCCLEALKDPMKDPLSCGVSKRRRKAHFHLYTRAFLLRVQIRVQGFRFVLGHA